jgi:hypothetical protein
MTSTFSGALRAATSERATASRNAVSSSRLVVARPCRCPNVEVTVKRAPPIVPLVAPPREAKRKLSVSRPSSHTRHPSAFENARVRRPSCSVSACVKSMGWFASPV